MNKITEREKDFRKKEFFSNSNIEIVRHAQKERKSQVEYARGGNNIIGRGRRNFRGRGGNNNNTRGDRQ